MKITPEMRKVLRPFIYGAQIDPIKEAIDALAPLILEQAALACEEVDHEEGPCYYADLVRSMSQKINTDTVR